MEDMPKAYQPEELEEQMLDRWIGADCYRRSDGEGDCTITIPPPNVTGRLHMGHALNDTIQDAVIRFNRMHGRSTRWILGTDHAGIATQTQVDKKLASEGISRHAIGRDAFIQHCWDWTHEYGGIIVDQIRRMGCSVDFEDEKFTMSPEYANAVRKVFVDWYHDDLVYRGNRIVNWCPSCTTAIADDEVEHHDEHGHLWRFKYPLEKPMGDVEYIEIATTRPETILGDVAIAVSHGDERYEALVGSNAILPINGRKLPIFADHRVDPAFGTGAVKITPAHDPNDYAMGIDHDLEQVNVFDENAVVNELGGVEYEGMTRDIAREAVIRAFDERGLLAGIDDHDHAVGHCYRCHTALEPWLSEQWFVDMKTLSVPAIKAVEDGRVTFHPDRWEHVYMQWMENLHDWCISRQLWWGHRIPVFSCEECGWEDALMEDVETCPVCGADVVQDPDVLDTWFSSQLWTFATQGWPENPEELEGHHPTTVLSTARDIISLWVARMIMSSLYFLDEVPFHDVIIHPIVLAKDGTRMSKSKGNGVDPMDLIDSYGADAMRFGLLLQVTGSQDMRFDEDRIANAKSFSTKIWNAARFVLSNAEGYTPGEPEVLSLDDAWMFSRLATVAADVTRHLEEYTFGEMTRELYAFTWNEFCDWYIEFSKPRLQDPATRLQAQRNLMFVLENTLKLLHPTMPFITESIHSHLPGKKDSILMLEDWVDVEALSRFADPDSEQLFGSVRTIVSAVRNARARYGISPKQKLAAVVRVNEADKEGLTVQLPGIAKLVNLESLELVTEGERPARAATTIEGNLEVYVLLEGHVDFEAERDRIMKSLEKVRKNIDQLSRKLSNPNFVEKADPEIVERDRARLAENEAEAAVLRGRVDELL